jgi:hypothetical protein
MQTLQVAGSERAALLMLSETGDVVKAEYLCRYCVPLAEFWAARLWPNFPFPQRYSVRCSACGELINQPGSED